MKKPKIGQLVKFRGEQYRILRILKFGTIDILSLDGNNAFRISGLKYV